ncbi:hypothetical protein AYI70_g10086 [Smittium culicis]|uniref:Uncharacterized protein n=1 Tax=Smittium culicis TaxID=133412 RepID=A0A1R1X893_9FUNG|nr:hypothetical protein AYI70_g10086 [Smittium culicis]
MKEVPEIFEPYLFLQLIRLSALMTVYINTSIELRNSVENNYIRNSEFRLFRNISLSVGSSKSISNAKFVNLAAYSATLRFS